MKTAHKKRRVVQEPKVDKGTDQASGSDVKETASKKDDNTLDDSLVTKGKATSESSEQPGGNEAQRDENSAMSKITADEQNLNFPNELRKRKRTADAEIAEAVMLSVDKSSSRLRPRKVVPSFQMVELNENDSERIVGMRIKVYWPDSRKWFAGRVGSFNRENMLHRINYDDGDVEELDLRNEKFELKVKPDDGFRLKTELRSRKSKKDHSDDVGGNSRFSQEYDKVKDTAEIEGESTKSAEPKEDTEPNPGEQQPDDNKSEKDDTEPNPGEQQPDDNKSEKDETQAFSGKKTLGLTKGDGSKKHALVRNKRM